MIKSNINQNYFILTGAMGAGKSTILKELKSVGYQTVDEPAREVIAQQRTIAGEGIYDHDPKLFYNLMLSRAIFQYEQYDNNKNPIIWDRGIADNIAYGDLFNINVQAAKNAANIYRYHGKVFFLPAWEKIYTTDEERKMSFLDAKLFGENLKKIYVNLGYQIIEVPFDIPEMRAKFIIDKIQSA